MRQLFTHSLQDTPAWWVATHRLHHAHSDTQDDPHSPLVTFFWAHLGWLFTTPSGAAFWGLILDHLIFPEAA